MLYQLIKKIYPTIQDGDFILQNDGNGDYIKEWKSTFKKPTDTELATAKTTNELSILKDQAIKKYSGETFKQFLDELYEDWKTKNSSYQSQLTKINSATLTKIKDYVEKGTPL